MDLDDIREILYAYSIEVARYIDDPAADGLYDDTEVESLVEEFILGHEDLLGDVENLPVEESY